MREVCFEVGGQPHRFISLVVAAGLVALAGCAIVPPPAMPFDGVAAERPGSTAIRAYGSGVLLYGSKPMGAGGGLHVNQQLNSKVSLAFDGAGGGDPLCWTFAGRVGGRYTFEGGHFALTGGLGGEYVTDAINHEVFDTFLTADVGARAGTIFAERYELYGAATISGLVEPRANPQGGSFLVAHVGLNVLATPHWRLGFDLAGVVTSVGISATGATAQGGFLGVPVLVPTFNFGYVVGVP
jgi:hypothetical protein